MAEYSTIINSKFEPISFERYLKPYQMYAEEYRAQEDALSELTNKASIWEDMANEQTDPYAYSVYKKYSEDLNNAAEQLASQGLSPISRQNMLKMKQRYSSDIIPIEQAYQRRQSLVDEQRKLSSQDNTMMFDIDASSLSLDDLIKNPQLTYTPYSGSTLTKQVSNAAKNLSKVMREDSGTWKSILGDQYYEKIMREGYSPEEILQVLSTSDKGTAVLRGLVEDAVNSSGIAKWNDPIALKRAYEYAGQGLWDAIGKTSFDRLSNKYYTNNGNKPKTTKSDIFRPRLAEGAQGEEDKSLKTLKGLRKTQGGYSTDTLDLLKSKVEKHKNILDKYSKDDILAFEQYRSSVIGAGSKTSSGVGSYASLGRAMNATTGVPRGYNEYNKVKRDYDEAVTAYNEEQNKVNSLIDRYSHLGTNSYDQLNAGLTLDSLQQAQELTSFALNLKQSDYNNVRSGIANLLGAMNKENIDAGTQGLVDSRGKTVKYSKVEEIIDALHNPEQQGKITSIKVSGGNDPKLQIMYNGEPYTIKGEYGIESYQRDLKVTNDYLKDFSKDIIPYTTIIPEEDLLDIYENGIENYKVPKNTKFHKIPGSNFIGTTLYSPAQGDYVKIMLDKNGNILGVNTLKQELSGGDNRDSYFTNMAEQGLSSLLGLFASEE